jgi:Uma2 family endonuclease
MELGANFEDVSTPVRKTATYAELEALPENVVGQIIDGELVAMPRPGMAHSYVAGNLFDQLNGPFTLGSGGPGGWWILFGPEVHLGSDVLVPDLAGWQRSRLPTPSGAFATLAPDWSCEVLSPATAQLDRTRKLRIYAREQVGHVWLADPGTRVLEVYERRGEEWLLRLSAAGDARVRAPPFEALEIDLALLWLPEPTSDADRKP